MRGFVAAAVTTAALAGAGGGMSPALASTCQPFSATAHDTASSPGGPYVGVEDITIGGTSYGSVPAVTFVLAPLTPEGGSGVLTTTTGHAISLPWGTLTTIDSAHLIPTGTPGVYKLVSHLVVTGGATGQLQLQATLDLGTLSAVGTIVGTVCGI